MSRHRKRAAIVGTFRVTDLQHQSSQRGRSKLWRGYEQLVVAGIEMRKEIEAGFIGGRPLPSRRKPLPCWDLARHLQVEIVNLDFEQGDPDTNIPRMTAFIAHYGITYPVLVVGTTDQLAEKIPQGVNLNRWLTSFFVGRDGLVKETHAGFAGPGNTEGHIALERKSLPWSRSSS